MGVHEMQRKQYVEIPIAAEWEAVIGTPEQGFTALIWGISGHGKTTFALKLCKELARHGRVLYNSVEQGFSKSLRDATQGVGMSEVAPGRFLVGDRMSYDEMCDAIIRSKITFVVIDSLQYMNLTSGQYKALIARFPKKSFLIISWEGSGSNPKGEHGKSIRYMVDIKIRVHKGLAVANSRFARTVPYRVMDWATAPEPEKKSAKPADENQLELVMDAEEGQDQ